VANPNCELSSLIDAGVCIKEFDRHRRKALKVFFMSRQLAAIGGTNYTLGPSGTLNTAAVEYCALSSNPDQLNVAWITLEMNNALEAGATFETDKNSLSEEIRCLEQFPDWKLLLMELLLRCQLGRADSYPQT